MPMPLPLPGYYLGLRGECMEQEFAEIVDQPVMDMFSHVFYQGVDTGEFRVRSFPQYFQELLPLYQHNRAHLPRIENQLHFRSIATYYYNRQLIVQMTSLPSPTTKFQKASLSTTNRPSIPIERARGRELQADLLHLQAFQRDVNFHIPYLLIVIDPFSRFVYAEPVKSTQASAVFQALTFAIQHDQQDIYRYFREHVRVFTVDGGVEFQGFFAQNLQELFPQAEIRVAHKKSGNVGGKPGSSGPVERVIRTLRKLIRDYSFSTHHAFLERNEHGRTGLEAVVRIYNSTMLPTLGNRSPQEVMQTLIRNDLGELGKNLENEMHSKRLKQIGKRQIQDNTMQTELTKHQFLASTGHMVVRLYRPPGLFAKEVDIRVSLETYLIESVENDNRHCVISQQGSGERQRVLLSLCVMIKTPVWDGPALIRENLTREVNYSKTHHLARVQPHQGEQHEQQQQQEVPNAMMMRRAVGRYTPGDFHFSVTPEIQQAVGGNVAVQQVIQAPVDPPPRRNPTRAARSDARWDARLVGR